MDILPIICFIFDQDQISAGDKLMLTIIITTMVVARPVGAMLACFHIWLSIQGKAKILNIYSPSPGLAEHLRTCKIHSEKNISNKHT